MYDEREVRKGKAKEAPSNQRLCNSFVTSNCILSHLLQDVNRVADKL